MVSVWLGAQRHHYLYVDDDPSHPGLHKMHLHWNSAAWQPNISAMVTFSHSARWSGGLQSVSISVGCMSKCAYCIFKDMCKEQHVEQVTDVTK